MTYLLRTTGAVLLLLLAGPARAQVNFEQAEIMLRFLRGASQSAPSAGQVDEVMRQPGTELILRQQNITREVTAEQYRALLLRIADENPPALAPASASERARRGLDGLLKNVWPGLRWGVTHTDLLDERLRALRQAHVGATARSTAERYLPEKVPIAPKLFVVMGGRAGATALDPDLIYFDLLASSFHAEVGSLPHYPNAGEIDEFIAHEIHHLGLQRIAEEKQRSLNLSAQEARAYSFLSFLVLEGSATYLINEHRRIEDLRRSPPYQNYLAQEKELFTLCGGVLEGVLDGGLSDNEYEKATASLAGMGWHTLGALMLAPIDRTGGLEAVFRVLRDPRQFLREYNAAVARANGAGFTFSAELADRVSRMGQRR